MPFRLFFFTFIATVASHTAGAQEPKPEAPLMSGMDYIGDESLWKSLEKGEVVLLNASDGEDKENSHTVMAAIIVDAPVKEAWEVVADKESAPEYIDNLESARIIEKTETHILIEQVMKLGPLPRVTYVVKHEPTPHRLVKFNWHSGDMKDINGFWKFFPVDEGQKCLVVYRLGLKPGFLVPDFVVRKSLQSSLPEALKAMRTQVMKRKPTGGSR